MAKIKWYIAPMIEESEKNSIMHEFKLSKAQGRGGNIAYFVLDAIRKEASRLKAERLSND